jgi:hypothetical protein
LKTVRIITDNVRAEKVDESKEDSPLYFNTRSGEDMLRYIRGGGVLRIPVLVFCFASIDTTRYVEEFPEFSGSTVSSGVVLKYIEGLAEGKETDNSAWAGFKRIPSAPRTAKK